MNSIYNGPFYRYDMNLLNATLSNAQQAAKLYNCEMYYALKANNENEILRAIQKHGLGVDCVTGQEIEHALRNGWNRNQIVFAGSGKTYREIEYAIREQIRVIHCESPEEWDVIKRIQKNYPESATRVALRINPDVQVNTHAKISTGERHHKFGMPFHDALSIIEKDPSIIGFHVHVGSQVLEMHFFESLSKRMREFIDLLPSSFHLEYLNLGGGLGIDYAQPDRNPIPDFYSWMKSLRKFLPFEVIEKISLEPGRSIVGQCGVLVGQVQYVKNVNFHPLAILDIGMTEILRPALYGARHKITVQNDEFITSQYTVSGPSCESSDTFGAAYELPILSRGDLVTVHSCGAYGSSMQLRYNLRNTIPSKYVNSRVETKLKSSSKSMVA